MDVDDFVDAVRRVGIGRDRARSRGGRAAPVAAQSRKPARRADSARELEVLALMAEGRSNAAIARALVLTVGAVEKHVASILTKLRLPPSSEDHRRVLAVLAYLRDEPMS